MKQIWKSKRFYIILSFLLVSLLIFILSKVLPAYPDFVERYYSRGLYPWISQPISWFFGLFPVSMAELLIAAAILFSLLFLIFSVVRTIQNKKRRKPQPYRPLLRFLTYGLCLSCSLYCCFYLFWGFQFSRKPLAENLGYQTADSSVEELTELCRELAKEINRLRPQVEESQEGVMRIGMTDKELRSRASIGYEKLAEEFPLFQGSYSMPNALLSSTAFCYMGITGIFIPFTFEANINSRTPDCSRPATILHEMAHQRGFCREDEANFIAFLACRVHTDIAYQYSGYYLAFVYSLNALYGHDSKTASEIRSAVDAGYLRDAAASSAFWKQFEGPVENVSSAINDSYLQHNGQEDGVHSYGRMVDLLLAERRNRTA